MVVYDQMDETSNPYFYANIKNEEAIIGIAEEFIKEIMTKFGFAQHPNEWYFSYGDQLWAWKIKRKCPLWKNLNLLIFI